MATFTKLNSGSWRVQVRRKGRYVSETFIRHDHARKWATEAENQIDRGHYARGETHLRRGDPAKAREEAEQVVASGENPIIAQVAKLVLEGQAYLRSAQAKWT